MAWSVNGDVMAKCVTPGGPGRKSEFFIPSHNPSPVQRHANLSVTRFSDGIFRVSGIGSETTHQRTPCSKRYIKNPETEGLS